MYLLVMIKHALRRFNHNYIEPRFWQWVPITCWTKNRSFIFK